MAKRHDSAAAAVVRANRIRLLVFGFATQFILSAFAAAQSVHPAEITPLMDRGNEVDSLD